MSLNTISVRSAQKLMHSKKWYQHQAAGCRSACNCLLSTQRQTRNITSSYQQASSSFSSFGKGKLSASSHLQQPTVLFCRGALCSSRHNVRSAIVRNFSDSSPKQKLPPESTSSTTTTTVSGTPQTFLQNIKGRIGNMHSMKVVVVDETKLFLRDVHAFFTIDLPILIPRLLAFCTTVKLSQEYGLDTVACEGPSMEPTILNGSYTCVLMEKWSHRIFCLETSSYYAGDDNKNVESNSTTDETRSDDDCNGKDIDKFLSSVYELFGGIWKQHFTSGLQHGDVIIMKHPIKDGQVCKRIIGMPGDTIVRTDGMDDEYSSQCLVPPGHMWVEGDNTLNSSDSRFYGAVPASLVVGKVICRLWPLREYMSLGLDGNGMEHWKSIPARIGRDGRPTLIPSGSHRHEE